MNFPLVDNAAYLTRGDVLADGRIVWSRFDMSTAMDGYMRSVTFTDGSTHLYDSNEAVDVVRHIPCWQVEKTV